MTNNVLVTASAARALMNDRSSSLQFPFYSGESGIFIRVDGNASSPPALLTRDDKNGARFAVIDAEQFTKLPPKTASDAFARIARVVEHIEKKLVRLPESYSAYHYNALLSFFAVPRSIGDSRWITCRNHAEGCVYFLEMTASKHHINLEDYTIPQTSSYRKYIDSLIAESELQTDEGHGNVFVEQYDFSAIGGRAISSSRCLEEWQDDILTTGQKAIMAESSDCSMRIVGPAGSGKTLALCLKALKGIREDKGRRDRRVLFATHSWAMAERIDDALISLNGGAQVDEVTVMPLVNILRDIMGESHLNEVTLLGDDSEAGRRMQFELLTSLIESFPKGDRAVLEGEGLSEHIRKALDPIEKKTDKADLVENLYYELNCFLLPKGLIPGDKSKERDYLNQSRTGDLPPFPSRGDRMFVLHMYRGFLAHLAERNCITIEQFVSDALRMLETFSWRLRRETEGYDRIFVDELQYFDAQERLVLSLLASAPDSATIITAEDPTQGLFSTISEHWRGGVSTRTENKYISLDGMHRFTPAIMAFVKHLYMQFPLNAQPIQSGEEAHNIDNIPEVVAYASRDEGIDAVKQLIQTTYNSLGSEERLAVIGIDTECKEIADALRALGINSMYIESLEDTERLQHARRSVVVGDWRFLGGTQFTHVIVLSSNLNPAGGGFVRIRRLNALYVASSRASQRLVLVVMGNTPQEVADALEKGLLK